MPRLPKVPQRPLWQQLAIWVVALGIGFGIVVSGNATLEQVTPDTVDVSDSAPPVTPTPDGAEEAGEESRNPPGVESDSVEDDPAANVETGTETGTAADQLAQLPIKARAPRAGYDREGQFGRAWLDVDNNGCDTRNDILTRDLDDTVIDNRCRVLSGVLREPFSGDTINFERGEQTSALVHIDHVVALSNAWQTGAQDLTQDQRIQFANDPLNLIAVSGRLNQEKGDSDAASWLPPDRAYWCEYVARQVGVKAQYDLWVTQAEHDQMARVLFSCPGYPALTSSDHGRFKPGEIPLP
jgi:hypothetical protein